MAATRILLGNVVTMDPALPRAEAVAFEGDRILAVGKRDDVLRTGGDQTQLLDFGARTILPGFVEAHGHPLWSALVWGEPVIDIRAENTPTYAAVLAKIGRRVAKAAPGEFLMAVGLDPTLHTGMQEPTVDELDALAPDNPLAVVLFNFHGVYANTAAVRACGLDGALDPHVASQIRRDAAGRPWKFTEDAGEVVRNTFFERCGKERSLREAADWVGKFSRAGYTTASEMGTLQEWQGFIPALMRQHALPIRIRAYERAIKDRPFWSRAGAGDDRYALIGMKIWADGSLFVGNVGLSRPYLNTDVTIRRMGMPPDNPGHMNYTRDDLLGMIEAAAARGFQLSVHTQGMPRWTWCSTATPRCWRGIRRPRARSGSSTAPPCGRIRWCGRMAWASCARSSTRWPISGATRCATRCSGRRAVMRCCPAARRRGSACAPPTTAIRP